MIEDLFLALYLAALAPILGEAEGVGGGRRAVRRALAFLVVLGLVARYGTRVVGALIASRDDELLVVLFVGFALLVAGIAFELGVSDAIGAFMAGLVLAGTASARRIQRLVLPLRDAFAALFFFAFGLSIDVGDFDEVVAPAVAAVSMSIVLAVIAGVGVARINGLDREAAANIALHGRGAGRVRADPGGAGRRGGLRRPPGTVRRPLRPGARGDQPAAGQPLDRAGPAHPEQAVRAGRAVPYRPAPAHSIRSTSRCNRPGETVSCR